MFLPAQHELLLQIIAAPDDDQLRFVLADKLNELADPLGELISVQCMLERIRANLTSGDYRALKARERELVNRHGSTWHQAAAPFARKLIMRRGLPHTLYTAADALLRDGGLTVLAPIDQLELDHVDATQLDALFRLPLLQRIRSLGMPDLRGMARLDRKPAPIPERIEKLRLGVDGARALDASVTLGLLDHVRELEIDTKWIVPGTLELLEPPAAEHLTRLALHGQLPRSWPTADQGWLPSLQRLLALRPKLVIGWRGIDYDASNLERIVAVQDLGEAAMPQPAGNYNREPFGSVPDGAPVERSVSGLDFQRLPDGALLVSARTDDEVPEALQPLSLDCSQHLQLEPHPHVLGARAFEVEWNIMRARYEPWPSASLASVSLPLPMPIALTLVAGIARGLVALTAGYRALGLPGWPDALSLDDVLIGADGTTKLMPPFRNCRAGDEVARQLGFACDADLAGTDDGLLLILGTALMHLLASAPVERRMRPSSLDTEWKRLDALVEGCLARTRGALHLGVEAFLGALNETGLAASQESVAQHVQSKQSTSQ